MKGEIDAWKKSLKASEEKEKEDDPAAAAAKAAAIARKKRQREAAQKLGADVERVIRKEITDAFEAKEDSQKKVKAVKAKYKDEIAVAVAVNDKIQAD